jgi:hypothetical protein
VARTHLVGEKAWRAVIALHSGHAQHARHSDGAGQDVDGDAGVQRAGTGGGVNNVVAYAEAGLIGLASANGDR